jgi:hypothetical protein
MVARTSFAASAPTKSFAAMSSVKGSNTNCASKNDNHKVSNMTDDTSNNNITDDNTNATNSNITPPTNNGRAAWWKKGQSGNLKGRPKGVANRFSRQLVEDFAAHWREHGMAAIDKVFRKDPTAYLKIACQLVPRELLLSQHVTVNLEAEVNEEQLERIVEAAKLEQEKRAATRAKAIEAANANQGELVVYKS